MRVCVVDSRKHGDKRHTLLVPQQGELKIELHFPVLLLQTAELLQTEGCWQTGGCPEFLLQPHPVRLLSGAFFLVLVCYGCVPRTELGVCKGPASTMRDGNLVASRHSWSWTQALLYTDFEAQARRSVN